MKADVGRFTIGGRRCGEVYISSRMSRHTFHRVCLPTFRRTIGRTRPGAMVYDCGGVGKIFTSRGRSLLAGVLQSR